jgi:HD-GYP domain-containing protein (c-di-GMP phosphodiesterase class II)
VNNPNTPNMATELTDADKRALANQQALGRDLVTQLYICLKTASFYDPSNDNFRKQIYKFRDLLQIASEISARINITSVDGYLFMNEDRLKINLDGYLAAKFLQRQFEQLHVAGLDFSTNASMQDLTETMLEAVGTETVKIGAEALNAIFKKKGILSIKFIPSLKILDEEDESLQENDKLNAKQAFFRAIGVVQEVLTNYAQGRKANIVKAKRAVHSLVDQIIRNESYMLELTALKKHDQYTYKHSVNVSVFAVALGMRLGFGKSQLAELGFAALFHDFGKTKIPIDLLNKPDGLDSTDWSQMQEHPVYGAKALAQSFAIDRYASRAMLVAFEHHKNLDGTGYPYINRAKSLNLHSRIVALCDFFDALTSGRTYRKDSLPVDEVILKMIRQSNVKFDPYLLKVLINIIGVYPVGTLLLLDTGELALVKQNNPDDIFRPDVKIIADRNGKKVPAPVARLSSYDEKNKRYFRNVLHMVDPDRYHIDISQYILED